MKRKISFLAVAVCTACLASAQTKKEQLPPPPPPPPPVAAIAPVPPPPPPTPKSPAVSLPDDHKDFLKRNPGVKSIGWVDNNTVRIHLRSGKDEVYDLNDKEQVQRLESKYGKLPVAPPPPPKPLPPPPPKAPKIIKEEA